MRRKLPKHIIEYHKALKKDTDFEQFYKENYSRFFYFTFHIVDDEEVSRDIVGDAFEYAWQFHYKADIKDWSKYMYSYLRNKSIDFIRHQVVHTKYAEYYLQMGEEESGETGDDDEEKIRDIMEILPELTPKTRLVLEECYLNHKKYHEVAEALEISESAVRKHIVQALKTIREKILKKYAIGVYQTEDKTSNNK